MEAKKLVASLNGVSIYLGKDGAWVELADGTQSVAFQPVKMFKADGVRRNAAIAWEDKLIQTHGLPHDQS